MRRLRVIDSPEHRMGGEVYYRHAEKYEHDPELMEAYECGYKAGRKEAYKEIMEEQYGGYHERRIGRTMPPMMRERDWDDDDYSERRRRDSRGRYI